MDTDQQQTAEKRKKRVQRLKKMIILSIVIGIIVPWMASAILFVFVFGMHRQWKEANGRLDELTQTVSEQGRLLEELRSLLQEEIQSREQLSKEIADKQINSVNASVPQTEAEELTEEPEEQNVHKVYLTFDDGPSIYTNDILDILKEYDVKATFFVLGKETEEAKQAMRRIVEEGHSLGMHSYNHQYDQIYASKEAFAEDFHKIQDYLYQVTGVESHLYRFPGGSSNTVTNVDVHEFIEYLQEVDTAYYDWNVSSGDAAKELLSAETIVRNATAGIEKFPTAVILFHDAASRRTTVDALPTIIEKLQAMENVEILPITEDTELIQHVKAKDAP